MPSEKTASAVNILKGNLAAGWNLLEGSSADYTDLGVARRFGGAAAAYSLRDIGAMNGRVVRVRRDTGGGAGDDEEEDFSASQVASGALESFVGAGNDGYVSIWYDQSGNGNDAFQTTYDYQPKIIDNGSIELSPSGQPTVRFLYTSPNFSSLITPIGTVDNTNSVSFFMVIEIERALSASQIFLNLSGGSGEQVGVGVTNSGTVFNYGGFLNKSTSHTPSLNQNILYSVMTDSSNFEGFADGSSILTTPIVTTSITQNGRISSLFQGALHLGGTISEVILFNSGKADDRADIEGDISNHYNITLS